MVLGILTAIAACPAIVGTTEAVRQGQRKSAKEKHRGLKSNLVASSISSNKIDRCAVVLHHHKLYITVSEAESQEKCSQHPFAGYFLPYPDQDWGRNGEGLVSTISDDPPQLNWVYVDQDTHEVKYGLRTDAEDQLVGPWDCTPIDRRITLEGWEGFMAVEEEPESWALYFDRHDDGLGDRKFKHRILEVELTRKERRRGKDWDEE